MFSRIEQGVFDTQLRLRVFYSRKAMSRETTAVFIGHRDCYEVTEETVTPIIEKVINEGVVDFLNGAQGHFDEVCARAVYKLKSKYPQIRSYVMIPYESFKIFDKSLFDEVVKPYPDGFGASYYKGAIPFRNRTMVSYAGVAICYVEHKSRGSAITLETAQKYGVKIYNLFRE